MHLCFSNLNRLEPFALKSVACAALFALLAGVLAAPGAEVFRVPLMQTAPKLDGQIEPREWAASAGFDGFITLNEGKLQRRRARGFVGATATHLYVALQTQLPDEGALVAEVKTDSLKAVYDDAAEVFVCPTPDAADRVDYQFLCNSLGKGGYNIHLLGAGKEEPGSIPLKYITIGAVALALTGYGLVSIIAYLLHVEVPAWPF